MENKMAYPKFISVHRRLKTEIRVFFSSLFSLWQDVLVVR